MNKPNAEICVLVVDDSALSRRFAKDALAPEGYQIKEAAGAEEALTILGEGEVDLVLLDLLMPGITAPTGIVPEVKAIAPDTPIVVASANIQAKVRQAVIDAGAINFVAKPIKADELRQVVKAAFSAS